MSLPGNRPSELSIEECSSLANVLTAKALLLSSFVRPCKLMDKVGKAIIWEQGPLSSKRNSATISFSRPRDDKHILAAISGGRVGNLDLSGFPRNLLLQTVQNRSPGQHTPSGPCVFLPWSLILFVILCSFESTCLISVSLTRFWSLWG